MAKRGSDFQYYLSAKELGQTKGTIAKKRADLEEAETYCPETLQLYIIRRADESELFEQPLLELPSLITKTIKCERRFLEDLQLQVLLSSHLQGVKGFSHHAGFNLEGHQRYCVTDEVFLTHLSGLVKEG